MGGGASWPRAGDLLWPRDGGGQGTAGALRPPWPVGSAWGAGLDRGFQVRVHVWTGKEFPNTRPSERRAKL